MDISGKLKQALKDRGWTQRKLCSELGITETGLKYTMDNNSWKIETLEKISSLLDYPISYFILERQENLDGNFGEQVLSSVTKEINELRHFFEEEIRTKNQQIAGLQRMLESVLGKSKDAIQEPLSPIEFTAAVRALQKKGIDKVRKQPARNTLVAKSVASR